MRRAPSRLASAWALRSAALLATLWAVLAAAPAAAHRASDAFLTLHADGTRLSGQWEIALRDLEVASGLDADSDGAITWGELERARPRLEAQLQGWLRLGAPDAPCAWRVTDLLVNPRIDGSFAWFALEADCPRPAAPLQVDYGLLFDVDPGHRGIVVLEAGARSASAVLSPERPVATLDPAPGAGWRTLRAFLVEGVHHIWIGADHLLFLLSLLLPAALVRQAGRWQPASRVRPVLLEVTAVVTAFTLAHSLTLSLAALGWLRVPLALAEAAIAASVVVAALNNVWPVVTRRRWLLAFGFGLLHGVGFASVLGELAMGESRLLALLGFNLGVELGQLAIVLLAAPLLYALRTWPPYGRLAMPAGSLAVAALGAWWLVERLQPS